ncbi:AraC family transcriptional regulator [Metapseudomonas resinovorans]|uniref:Putative AraC family transcriptional regulator n=1 Tax=Metapseudomonas resinovorans NBRC 106553 TaxID=1245471 RepID=S6AM46_METRE|nr:AraC family transcriptional regulator [Pseudomonas resinovorans]BAN46503.1 putative AraC family transcriptional regulator [Pseudomonas resinovorans NBRC 106553]
MSQSLFSTAALHAPMAGNVGVLSAAASGLDRFITGQGGDLDRIFGRAGIDPERLLHPTLSLALTNYCQVLEEAARQSGCDNFGLRYGQQFQPRDLGLLGYVGLFSSTLEEALKNFAAAFPYHQHSTLIRLVDCGECYRFDYQVRHGAILDRRQDAELTMGMALNLVRHVLGHDWTPRAVAFEHERPEGWREHGEAFGAPVQFGRPCNFMLLPKGDVQGRAMPEGDPNLLFLFQDVIRRLGEQGVGPSLVEEAGTQIRLALAEGEPCLERIAERLELTPAGLQRRLREENLCFSQVVERTRRELALHYLRQRQRPISELAPLLGYSETSAFSRAFRRWFGVSPRQWRGDER